MEEARDAANLSHEYEPPAQSVRGRRRRRIHHGDTESTEKYCKLFLEDCHHERSEGSAVWPHRQKSRFLRYARNDNS